MEEKHEKIRVVQLIHGLNMGGAEALVKEYALRLDKNKFEVVILCYERLDSPYYKYLKMRIYQLYMLAIVFQHGEKGIYYQG